jgi:exodeoxyribonuclease-3
VSPRERDAFKKLIELGLEDSFRLFDKNEGQFSWWDYRMAGFRRNLGMRIDHILITPALKEISNASYIDKAPRKLERPSDHTPVVLEMAV